MSKRIVYLTCKRVFDIIGALCMLLVLLVLYIPIAILIKLDSPGKVLLWQDRIGRNGIPFKMPKFRSMIFDDQSGRPEKLAQPGNDRNVTRVGKWLRDTKLDELPQAWLILLGIMSIVGPRPVLASLDAIYMHRSDGFYRLRNMDVDSGLLSSASALVKKKGPEYQTEDGWRWQLESDVQYREQQSFLIDLKCIWANFANRCGRDVKVFDEEPTLETLVPSFKMAAE